MANHFDFQIRGESRLYVGSAAELLGDLLAGEDAYLITDEQIAQLYPDLLGHLPRIVISGGEEHKSLATIEQIHRRLIEHGADRRSFVVGLGGGIVTDMAGFAASTYMRGIRFGFVSTTLLGQVDASIGGKNGVNVGGYKNMAGTFNQPSFVVLDPAFLATLPDREFRAGLAEVIKSAIIDDKSLFDLLEKHTLEGLRSDLELLGRVVRRAVGVKVRIVERDLRESGDRRLLNLGHTLAHAIEKCSQAMNHGEAVAVGLKLVSEAAQRMGLLAKSDATRIGALLDRYQFRVEPPVEVARLVGEMVKDKKSVGAQIDLILPCTIGHCRVERVAKEQLAQLFL